MLSLLTSSRHLILLRSTSKCFHRSWLDMESRTKVPLSSKSSTLRSQLNSGLERRKDTSHQYLVSTKETHWHSVLFVFFCRQLWKPWISHGWARTPVSPVVHDENGQPGCLTRHNNNAPQCDRHEYYTGILADDLVLIILSMLDLQRGAKHVRDCYMSFRLNIQFGSSRWQKGLQRF